MNGSRNNPQRTLQSYTGSVSIRSFDFSNRLRKRSRAAIRTTPIEWAEQQATIVHPSLGRIPFAPYAYQRAFLDGYAAPRRIVVKARQIGFSQVFALEALYA